MNPSYCALQCYFCIVSALVPGRFCSLSDGEDDIDKMTSCPKGRLTPEARAACPGEVTRHELDGQTQGAAGREAACVC